MCEKVLDIGCGAKKEGTINVDINSAVKPDVVCDGHFLPFRNVIFDKCILKHVIEHAERPDQLMDECHRILKLNGLVYVTFPNFASFTVLLEWLNKRPAYSDELIFGSKIERGLSRWQWHKQLCTTVTVKSLLNHHRFNVKKSVGYPPNVGSRMMRFLGKFFVRLFPERAGNVTVMAKKEVKLNR